MNPLLLTIIKFGVALFGVWLVFIFFRQLVRDYEKDKSGHKKEKTILDKVEVR